jgi:hypothetical protein
VVTLKAFIALVVTWCLLAVAAVVAASTQRFEGLYMYLVAAAVLVGLVIVPALLERIRDAEHKRQGNGGDV